MITTASKWTPLFLLFPNHYLDNDQPWWRFDIERFNQRFEWESDDWYGLKDTVAPPVDTWMNEKGDCVDYAALIASYLTSTTDKSVSLAYLISGISGHVVCYTDDKVYSSGVTHEMKFDEYVEKSVYRKVYTKKLQ